MSYSQFEADLLLAIIEAADATSGGQVEVSQIASTIFPQVNEDWIRSALKDFRDRGYFTNYVIPLGTSQTLVTVSAAARRQAEAIKRDKR